MKKFGGKRRMTSELYVAKLKLKNPTLRLTGAFVNTATRVLHQCTICQHEWLAMPRDVTRTTKTTGCPKCSSLFIDMTGKRFSRVTVLGNSGERNHKGIILWNCLCDCGTQFQSVGHYLRCGDTKSCGCYNRDKNFKHGWSGTPEYQTLQDMILRCQPSDEGGDPNYGDRGIRVCDRWRFGEGDKAGIECFIEDMGPRPSNKHSIERVNNHRGYQPDNCKWVGDWRIQCWNKRDNLLVSYRGKQISLAKAMVQVGAKAKYAQYHYLIHRQGYSFLQSFLRLESKQL